MTEKLRALQRWLDQRSLRERVLVLLSAVAAVFALADRLALAPLAADREALVAEAQGIAAEIREIGEQTQRLGEGLAADPAAAPRIASLEQQIRGLDARLGEETIQLVSPDEMVRVFDDLLRRNAALHLIRLETQNPVALLEPDSDATPGAAPTQSGVFEHGLELELEGGYEDVLGYLRALEILPWHLFWDRVEYRVTEHPLARVILRVHTLSTREGWLRV